MNILNTLTLKHLKLNKKRTIVTIIGVILSAAMMIAVTSLVTSIQDLLTRSAIDRVGNFHGMFFDISPEQAKRISQEEGIKQKMYSITVGYAKYDEIKNADKPYIFVKQYDKASLENIARLKEGRLPQNDSELLIPEHLISNGKVQIKLGDTITLEVGDRVSIFGNALNQNTSYLNGNNGNGQDTEKILNEETKSYTVVGITKRPDIILEPYSAPGYTAVSFANNADIEAAGNLDLAILFKRVSASTQENLWKITEKNDVENATGNSDLLRASGSFKNDGLNQVLYGSATIVILLIIVGSVALIYNAFSISVTDRLRQFGMLSSVGATRRQIKKAVRAEAAYVTVIALPIGILCGMAGIGVTMFSVNPLIKSIFDQELSLKLVVSPVAVVIASLLVIVTVWVSSAIPAGRAVAVSPVEAIRQSPDIKLNKRQIRTLSLTRKLFGIEGDIALKNLKRNKKKYRATVYSLIISIVLFISVSSFGMYYKKSTDIGLADYNYDLNVQISPESFNGTDKKAQEAAAYDFFNEVAKLEGIDDYSIITKNYLATTTLREEFISKQIPDRYSEMSNSKEVQLSVAIAALDDLTFEEYLAQIGEDEAKYMNPDKPAGILINKAKIQDSRGKYMETEQLNWKAFTQDEEKSSIELAAHGDKQQNIRVSLLASSDKVPVGITYSKNPEILVVIVSRDVGEKISTSTKTISFMNMYLVVDKDKSTSLVPQIFDLYNLSSAGSTLGGAMEVMNVNETSYEQMLLLASVFIFGFITLITLIGVANIFNTISTNISLRRREFAMLKSIGMTPASFQKMINFESIFYGVKALVYGLPISIAVSYLMYSVFMNGLNFEFMLPWANIGLCIVGVMVIVFTTMMYSSKKIRKENIIDALRQENI